MGTTACANKNQGFSKSIDTNLFANITGAKTTNLRPTPLVGIVKTLRLFFFLRCSIEKLDRKRFSWDS